MTILEKWQQLSADLLACTNGSYGDAVAITTTTLQRDSLHFRESLVVSENELPFLCAVQVALDEEYLSVDRIKAQYQQGDIEGARLMAIQERLVALGWLVNIDQKDAQGNTFFAASELYQKLLEIWQGIRWESTPSGIQPIYPSVDDLAFPMTKETYERKLEKISDDLQALQLEIVTAETLEEDEGLNHGYYQEWLQKQKETISSLERLYGVWAAHEIIT